MIGCKIKSNPLPSVLKIHDHSFQPPIAKLDMLHKISGETYHNTRYQFATQDLLFLEEE
jgi:hypothetical protein